MRAGLRGKGSIHQAVTPAPSAPTRHTASRKKEDGAGLQDCRLQLLDDGAQTQPCNGQVKRGSNKMGKGAHSQKVVGPVPSAPMKPMRSRKKGMEQATNAMRTT